MQGAQGNATYRDTIRTSLIVDAQYLALCCPSHTATSAAVGKSWSAHTRRVIHVRRLFDNKMRLIQLQVSVSTRVIHGSDDMATNRLTAASRP